MAMFENFPYTDMHNLNLDWIIKIAKDFLDQYTHIQQLISDGEESLQNLTQEGLQQLQDKADTLEGLLDDWYNTHSEDIANQLADALSDLNDWYNTHSEDIAGQLADALSDLNDWYTEHQNYLNAILANKTAQFGALADAKTAECLESIPDDYTTLARDVAGIRSAVVDMGMTEQPLNPVLVAGGYVSNVSGVVVANAEYQYTEKISVQPGDIVSCETIRMRFIAAYNGNVLKDDLGSGNAVESYTVPIGVDGIIISIHTVYPTSFILHRMGYVNNAADDIEEIEKTTMSKRMITSKMENLTPLNTGYVSNISGQVFADDEFRYTDHIPVKAGDVLRVPQIRMRFITAYTGNVVRDDLGSGNAVWSYTVPVGVDSVVISVHRIYRSYLTVTRETFVDIMNDMGNSSYSMEGSLNTGESAVMQIGHIRKNECIAFSALLQSFSAIDLGRIGNDTGNYITITPTELVIHAGPATTTVLHNIEIARDISVNIKTDNNGYAKIEIFSNGADFVHNINWVYYGDYNIQLRATNAVITEYKFSYGCADIEKTIWIFGDSFLGTTYPERWAYYLVNNYDSCLINSVAGLNSTNAFTDLQNIMQKLGKRPRYIIWTTGMNDTTDGTNIEGDDWIEYVNKVIELCNEYHITPILATVPNVAIRNNRNKNEIVRHCGLRYIDFAKAVGSDDNNSWYSGYLSNDNVHPTIIGAKALYNRAITDVPELTYVNPNR